MDHLFPNFLVFRACGSHLASGKGADCLDCHHYMCHRSRGRKRTGGAPYKVISRNVCPSISACSALSPQYSVLPPRSLSEVTLNGRSNLTTCVKDHSCAIFSPENEMRKYQIRRIVAIKLFTSPCHVSPGIIGPWLIRECSQVGLLPGHRVRKEGLKSSVL